MKNLKNVNGAKALSEKEQKSINGGGFGIDKCTFSADPLSDPCCAFNGRNWTDICSSQKREI